MDTAMRDLERIQERDDDLETRRLVAWALAVLTTLAVVLSVAAVIGAARGEADAAAPPAPSEDRLLAALGAPGSDAPDDARVEPDGAGEAAADELPLDPTTLRFPDALTDAEERPEVAAALAAAEAELAHPLAEAAAPDAPAAFDAPPPLPRTLPAAVAAGAPAPALDRVVREDPLLEPAHAREEDVEAAPAGADGEFTLQVVSYDTRERAQLFADELRARGHRAFVRSAEVPGRGRYWRVRVGPFATLGEAESYRRAFEADEQIATFVVRRRD